MAGIRSEVRGFKRKQRGTQAVSLFSLSVGNCSALMKIKAVFLYIKASGRHNGTEFQGSGV